MTLSNLRLVGCLASLLLLQEAVAGTNKEGIAFLNENRERAEVVETASGLQYEVLQSGPEDGISPNRSSKCSCHYKGSLLDGQEFDSSYRRGQPMTFAPSGVVAGWTEALQLMRPGDKWKLFVPSELAYGDRGAGGKIPPGAVLIFELELIEIKESAGVFHDIVDYLKQQPMLALLIVGGVYMLFQNRFGGGGSGGKTKLDIDTVSQASENTRVFFDITIGDEKQDRVEFILFNGSYPKTAENFRVLCCGGGKGKSGKDLHFKGSKFHRIIPRFMCQGGDFTRGNGTGGESIYGEKFPDEWDNGYIPHDKPYLLSMANAGPNTNGSQFFITTATTPHLDGKHVVFGKVVEGVETVKKMEAAGSGGGTPKEVVVIADCGELKSKST